MNIYIHSLLDDHNASILEKTFGKNHSISFRQEKVAPNQPTPSFLKAEAILGNPPVSWFTNGQPENLVFWQIDSAGFDQFKGIITKARVANMGDWFAWPCAETIIAGILGLYRGLPILTRLQSEKKWVGQPLRSDLHLLHHKKVVVLGTGTIGKAVRSILNGFQAETRMVARTDPQADIHSKEELLKILPDIDLVINTLPGAAGVFVDETFLQSMKPGSVYANIGRGSTTDESALIKLLQTGHLAGAVLDVTEKEPLPVENPLWTLPNVILTQHTGGGQVNEDIGKVNNFIENLNRYLSGQNLRFEVDLSRGY